GLEQADHFAGKLLDADLAAYRVLPAEQLLPHGFADHADRLPCPLLGLVEVTPGRDVPVAGGKIIVAAAADHGGPVIRLVYRRHRLVHHRRNFFGGGDLVADGLDIGALEVGRPFGAGTEALAWDHHQQIAAHAGNLCGHRPGGAIAKSDHGDDGGHAD